MARAFLSLGHVLPARYPLAEGVTSFLANEHRLGRMLDCAVIAPRLQAPDEWSAGELGQPRFCELVPKGNPVYAWSYDDRRVWAFGQHTVASERTGVLDEGALSRTRASVRHAP